MSMLTPPGMGDWDGKYPRSSGSYRKPRFRRSHRNRDYGGYGSPYRGHRNHGRYRVSSDRYGYPRRRRRSRVVLVACSALVALSVLSWGTLQLLNVFGNEQASATAGSKSGATCGTKQDTTASGSHRTAATGNAPGPSASTPASAPAGKTAQTGKTATTAQTGKAGKAGNAALPSPHSIKVNVLNATKRSGLAKITAGELKKRGFTLGEVGNAPKALDKKVKGTGMLRGSPGADTTAAFKVLGAQLKGAAPRYDERDGRDVDLVIGNRFTKLTPKKQADQTLAALNKPSPKPAPTGSC